MPRPRVVFFQRKPYPTGNYSLEFIFSDLRNRLKDHLDVSVAVSTFYSNGVFRRLWNAIEAIFRQGDVNVVAGDIHYVAIFLRRQRTILTVLDCGFLYYAKGLRLWLEKLFWLRIPARRVSYITTISERTKRDILSNVSFDPDRIIVIPVAISSHFKYLPTRQVPDRAKPVLLQVGQAENKNLERIIYALSGMHARLSIIGEVSQRNARLLKEYGIDYVNAGNLTAESMVAAYAGCDALLFPSTFEGFGMPILEAQAVGRPVITSNIEPMSWVAGEGAYLVDPFSVDSIRAGIVKVLSDKNYRDELVAKGLSNVNRFSPDAIAKMYMDVITRIAGPF